MTIEGIDSRHTVLSSEHCTLPDSNSFCPTRFQFESYSGSSIEALHAVLRRLAGMDLPGKEHVEAYLRHVVRRNRRPRTLYSIMGSIALFLGTIRDNGKRKEFKKFAVKGNVIDMAVRIIIGVAFGKIVSSFVADVIMPPIGVLVVREKFQLS